MQTQAPTAKTPTLDQVPAVRQRELVQPEPTTNHSGAGGATDYLYFYRSNCPNCPPVSEFLKQTDIAGRALDVDTAEGMEYAMKYQVLSTPTVVLSDSKGTVVAKVGNVRQLKDQLGAPIGSAR
jgi:glutaredoxin